MKSLALAGIWLLLGAAAFGQEGAPAVSCESLAGLALPNVTITTAKIMGAGEFEFPPHPPSSGGYPPNMDDARKLPAVCTVEARLTPSSDSNINMKVWLPLSGWNGNYLAWGNGGWGGRISHGGLIDAVLRGYAAASTDSGHDVLKPEEDGGGFALGHPEKLIDFGYRAEHEMTVTAKAVIGAFYGTAPKVSYFYGARLGGYQGLTEARRYPEDYDAIIAEAPTNPFALPNIQQLWANWLIAQDPSRLIPQEKYTMIHDAVLEACDGLDGVKDGQLENPLDCDFDPQVLLCSGGAGPDCLTAPQLDLLKKFYEGPVNPRTGELIYPGPAFGSELSMFSQASGELRPTADHLFKYLVYQDPDWDWKTLDWDIDVENALEATAPMLTTDADLLEFIGRGGKLLLYAGWQTTNNPGHLIDYYNEVVSKVGADKAAGSIRLFTIPGAFREAPFDKIKTMETWVETGTAPDRIVAAYEKDGALFRTRPLCAYPGAARYRGTGSTDAAENFFCVEDEPGSKQ